MKLRIGLLGGGSWGTTVASLAARHNETIMWARNPETVEEINTHRSNNKYLPGAKLYHTLKATNDIEEAVHNADVVVWVLLSQGSGVFWKRAKSILRRGYLS